MKYLWGPQLIPVLVAVVSVLLLGHWCFCDRPLPSVTMRVPGTDIAGKEHLLNTAGKVDLQGTFEQLYGTPANLPGAWPRFRGADGTNSSLDPTRLARAWDAGKPPVLWSADLGEGYAGAAVLHGRVYVLDYDQNTRADVLRCLSLADGQDIWRRWYSVPVKRNHGMSRTVPAVTEKYVVTIGPKCHVLCVDAVTGDFRWGLDLVKQFHTKVPAWYAGQCPLIDGETAIIAPGGDTLMIAVDCATGKIRWQAPNPNGWDMTHSSILPATVHGQKMYIYCASGGVVGISATDGRVLWEYPDWKISIANVPTPVEIAEGRFFLCGGYNAGGMLLRVQDIGGTFVPTAEYRVPATVFGSDQQTPVFYRGYLYGVIPGGQLVCLEPTTGKQAWISGSTHRFGLGPYMIADGMIIVMNDDGRLTLAEASPSGYRQIAQADILEGHEAWAPFALAGGRLIARDLTKMVCLDVAKH